jgi:hypothetical protein
MPRPRQSDRRVPGPNAPQNGGHALRWLVALADPTGAPGRRARRPDVRWLSTSFRWGQERCGSHPKLEAAVSTRDSNGPTEPPSTDLVAPVATFGGVQMALRDHLVAFYRGSAERERLIFDHLEEGLRGGETCLYVTAEGDRHHFRAGLAADDPGIDLQYLEVREPSSTYLRGGTFSQDGMLEVLDAWFRESFEREDCGFARCAAEMSWALPHVSKQFIGELSKYEARVARSTRAYRQVTVCLYDMDRFGSDVISAMINAHPKVWIYGMAFENPYYHDYS